jgi:copper(I)-binding protein
MGNTPRLVLLTLGAMLGAGCAHSSAPPVETVRIERPIIRASEGQSGIDVAAYAAFVNPDADDAVIAAECSCAAAVELHVVRRENGSPRMTTDWPLELPAAARAEVAPGSPRHFMLIGIAAPIVVGDVYRMRFQLRSGREISADFVGVGDSAEAWRLAGPPA